MKSGTFLETAMLRSLLVAVLAVFAAIDNAQGQMVVDAYGNYVVRPQYVRCIDPNSGFVVWCPALRPPPAVFPPYNYGYNYGYAPPVYYNYRVPPTYYAPPPVYFNRGGWGGGGWHGGHGFRGHR